MLNRQSKINLSPFMKIYDSVVPKSKHKTADTSFFWIQNTYSNDRRKNYNSSCSKIWRKSGWKRTSTFMAVSKTKHWNKKENENPRMTYQFDVEKCKVCPQKEVCYKNEAKTKNYSVSIKATEHLEQMEFQESDYFNLLAKEIYKIEEKIVSKKTGMVMIQRHHQV